MVRYWKIGNLALFLWLENSPVDQGKSIGIWNMDSSEDGRALEWKMHTRTHRYHAKGQGSQPWWLCTISEDEIIASSSFRLKGWSEERWGSPLTAKSEGQSVAQKFNLIFSVHFGLTQSNDEINAIQTRSKPVTPIGPTRMFIGFFTP